MAKDTNMPIRILIAEDQRIVREGITALLEDEDDLEIVGEAANGAEAVQLFQALRPDLVLIDLQMPVVDGPEAIRQIRALDPNARLLALTTYATDEFIFTALRAGAQGYMLKDASANELLAAVRNVAGGRATLAPEVAARLVARSSEPEPDQLTPRELEVLRLIGQGLSNAEIAEQLVIAPRTAKVHVQNILAKLGATNRTEVVGIAVKRKLLTLE
jgi:DNA-binding NarL/FixJ family response regulator